MQITMTTTTRGSSDGLTVQRFEEGKTYDTAKDLSGSLAGQFIRNRQAVVTQAPTLEDTMAELLDLLGRVK